MDIGAKLQKYENFIETKLKPDLRDIEQLLASKASQCQDWTELKTVTSALKHFEAQNRDMNVNFELANGVSAFGKIANFQTTFVDVGLGCLLEMHPDEAGKYADIRLRLLHKEIGHLRDMAVNVKVRIKMVLLALAELQATLNS